jgi:hypothetical protein
MQESPATPQVFPYIYRWNWMGPQRPALRRAVRGKIARRRRKIGGGIMEIDDQESISAWADQTFGPASSNARVAARANEGMAELLRALIADDNHAKAAEKVANVVIVLCRLMTRLGRNLGEELARKMAINRTRQRNLTADGHGYHVRDKTNALR